MKPFADPGIFGCLGLLFFNQKRKRMPGTRRGPGVEFQSLDSMSFFAVSTTSEEEYWLPVFFFT